ncbi:MAG: hypothetical protein PVG90_02350 [Bacillota bacterium]|jgi:hypothetical protein
MKTDQPLLAILIGTLSGPVIESYSRIMKHFGLTTISALEAISLMWLTEPSWLLGILGALGEGAWVSLIIYYSAHIWGTDYFPIKAMLIAMTSESLIFNIFGILGGNEHLVQNVSGNYVHASAAAFSGLLVGFLMKKCLFEK